MEIIYILNPWHWWALAALFIIGELLAPCAYFLGWGVAALLTGFIARLMPELTGMIQLLVFICISAITVGGAHLYRRNQAEKAKRLSK